MACEISITTDGWQQIRDNLDDWDRASLIAAITDDTFERVFEMAGQHRRGTQWRKARRRAAPMRASPQRANDHVVQGGRSHDSGPHCGVSCRAKSTSAGLRLRGPPTTCHTIAESTGGARHRVTWGHGPRIPPRSLAP